ncbi:MAG: cardiolipin synthase, partial [Patescibacteria group bacterium]
MENRDTSSTLAWILIFLLFPIIGFFVYIFFGRNWKVINPRKKDKIKEIYKKTDATLKNVEEKRKEYLNSFTDCDASYGIERILNVSQRNSHAILTTNNSVDILQSGQEKFKKLEKDLKNAKNFIHMEYFIWRDDELTNKIKEILIQKAKAGVEVRIIYDPVGSLPMILFHRKYFKEMRLAGITAIPFLNKLSPLNITTVNYLLHRKIVVIDGVVGYTGGMNMGREYVDGGKSYKSWRDTHLRLEGNSVFALHTAFAVNWEESYSESLFNDKYFKVHKKDEGGGVPMQIISSEPDSYWQPIKQALFTMILAAKKHVYIQTPYFIPDSNLFEALKVIALAGVDVRIMVTGVPDKRVPYWAAFTYFEELLLAGAKIYHYNAGFLHSKTISVDGSICSIGTTNMDIRSLHLSHESNVIIYNEKIASQLEKDYFKDLKKCSEFTLKHYKKIGAFAKFRNSLV